MRPVFFATVVMMLATPAFAAEDLIVSSNGAALADAELATFTDFTGGVGAADAKEGGGGSVIIQMMQPAGQSASAAATSAFAARASSITSH